jgi:hypothetical protein
MAENFIPYNLYMQSLHRNGISYKGINPAHLLNSHYEPSHLVANYTINTKQQPKVIGTYIDNKLLLLQE